MRLPTDPLINISELTGLCYGAGPNYIKFRVPTLEGYFLGGSSSKVVGLSTCHGGGFQWAH